MIRSIVGAATVPDRAAPYGTVHWRCYYPAIYEGTDRDHQTGELPPDTSDAPWPLVLILPGVNIDASSYRWLAERLVATGLCVVVPSLVGEHMPGHVGLTPGIDITACTPDVYGTRPTCDVIAPVLNDVIRRASGETPDPVCAAIDVERVAIGGHSGGGTVALQSASSSWFPARARFGFAAHTMASMMLGYPPDTVLSLPGSLPTLLVAAELDGVMTGSVARYGTDAAAHDPVRATFDRAIIGANDDAYYAEVAGAVHASCVHPPDSTLARGFLDPDPVGDPEEHRSSIGSILASFLCEYLRDDDGATARCMMQHLDADRLTHWLRK